MQVSREPRICELCCSVVMVNKINSACCRITDLPSRRQWTKLFTIDVAKIPAKTNKKYLIAGPAEPSKCKWHRTIPWSLRKCIVSETWDVQLECLIPNGLTNLHIENSIHKWPRNWSHSLHFLKVCSWALMWHRF